MIYKSAVFYYMKELYTESKQKFEELQKLSPYYKSTSQYLSKIQKKMSDKERRIEPPRKDDLLARMQADVRAKKLEQIKERETTQQMQEEHTPQSQDKVLEAYRSAVRLFKQKNYSEALHGFQQLDKMSPDYKATRSYIMLIGHEEQKDQKAIMDEPLDENEAMAVRKAKQHKIEQEQRKVQKRLKERGETIYKQALKLYRKKDYDQAKEKFGEVEGLIPGYKSSLDYLLRIDQDIKRIAEEKLRLVNQRKVLKFKQQEEKLAKLEQRDRKRKERQQKREQARALKRQQEKINKKKSSRKIKKSTSNVSLERNKKKEKER